MSKYIAIITTVNHDIGDYDQVTLITSITDWKEVSDDDYEMLEKASSRSFRYDSKMPQFKVIERPVPDNLDEYIRTVIEQYTTEVRKEEERKVAAARKYEKQQEKKKLEGAEKKKERLRKQLAELEALEKNGTN